MIIGRCMDITISLLLLIFISPIILIIYTLLFISGVSPIYKSKRIGLNGKTFNCLKFTSMRSIESLTQEERKCVNAGLLEKGHMENDPRVTKIGSFIRRTSLDEIPQFLNVIIGDMSIVGPRPISEYEIHRYGKSYRHYTSTRPGITGLWQVSGRDDIGYNRRVALDRLYATKGGPLLNMIIFLKTPVVVLKMAGVH